MHQTYQNLKPSSQVFVGLAPGQQELPKFVTYKIRIDADKVGFSQNINITDFNEGGKFSQKYKHKHHRL